MNSQDVNARERRKRHGGTEPAKSFTSFLRNKFLVLEVPKREEGTTEEKRCPSMGDNSIKKFP